MALDESLMTNIALGLTSAIFAKLISHVELYISCKLAVALHSILLTEYTSCLPDIRSVNGSLI